MSLSRSTENELVQHLITGDANAFRDIYNAWHQKIFNFAFYLTKSKDLAEETVQEVFIKLWEKREALNPDTTLQSYLKKLSQNHIIDTFRKANTQKELQKKIFNNMAALHQVPADTLMQKQLEKAYMDAIDKLPPQKKIIYLMHRDEDLTYQEIAQRLGLSKNTVRNHMSEAIQSIRDHVRGNVDLACLIIAICLSKGQSN